MFCAGGNFCRFVWNTTNIWDWWRSRSKNLWMKLCRVEVFYGNLFESWFRLFLVDHSRLRLTGVISWIGCNENQVLIDPRKILPRLLLCGFLVIALCENWHFCCRTSVTHVFVKFMPANLNISTLVGKLPAIVCSPTFTEMFLRSTVRVFFIFGSCIETLLPGEQLAFSTVC